MELYLDRQIASGRLQSVQSLCVLRRQAEWKDIADSQALGYLAGQLRADQRDSRS
jgi:hypothetical protein